MILVQLFVASFFGWLQHEQHEIVLYLREENRVLKAQLRHRRLRLTDNDRRRLATLDERLGRQVLSQVATIVIPDTILRWHRHLIARKWTYSKQRSWSIRRRESAIWFQLANVWLAHHG